jgi:N-acetyl-gamma-glutamyl-phosphate reductase
MHKVFIDGEAGTTGLQIRERLEGRRDLELLTIDPALRKDAGARAEALNAAEVAILCLPDDAAREAVALISNDRTRVIDASTAHRTAEGWTYGFPEMSAHQRNAVAGAPRLSNPGCYPTGFIGLVRPLVEAGLIPRDFPLTVNAVSGYSGGGKGLIAEFEGGGATDAYRPYGYNLAHKHAPEMTRYAGLAHPPLFAPAVGRYAQGMLVEVPLQLWALPRRSTGDDLRAALAAHYEGAGFVEVADASEDEALQAARAGAAGSVPALDPESLNGTNLMRLHVFANEAAGQARLVAVLDNLGKGASGAAVQSLNLMLGLDEAEGLAPALNG